MMTDLETKDIELFCADASIKLRNFSFRRLVFDIAADQSYDVNRFYRSIPDINSVYARTIEHHFEVAVHAKKFVFPYELLRTKAPNQTDEEWNYQRGIYEPYTRSAWGRALNKTKIIRNEQNYSITGWDEEQRKYFYDDYPEYQSVESWFFDIYLEAKINFPNQLLVIEPRFIPTKTMPDGTLVEDQSKKIEPVCRIVEEKDVMRYEENQVTVIRIADTLVNNVPYPAFKVFDKTAIFLCTASASGDKITYTVTLYYTHNWGYVPCRKLKGKASMIGNEVFYESWFSDAIPDLNSALRLSSNLDMANYANVFPVRITREAECRHRGESGRCTDGQIWDANHVDGPRYVTCPSCKGSGRASLHSPLSGYSVPDSKELEGREYLPLTEVVHFVQPDTAAIDSLREQIKERKRTAFAFMYRDEETTPNTEDGVQMVQEENRAFYLQLSKGTFDDMAFAIQAMGHYRDADKFVMPKISDPTDFSFRTSADITAEIGKALESNMPQAYVFSLIEEAVKTRFNSNPAASEFIMASLNVAALWNYKDAELIPFLNKTVNALDMIVKQRTPTFLQMAFDEHEEFSSLDPEEQRRIIYGYAEGVQKTMPVIEDPFAADAIAGGGQSPQDNLKGSVGGLTGITQPLETVPK